MAKSLKIFLVSYFLMAYMPIVSSQVHPEWFDKIQFFQACYGYTITPGPIMEKVPFTGSAWIGIYVPTNLDSITIQNEVSKWHSEHKVYMFGTLLNTLYNDYIDYIPNSHRLIDLNGEYYVSVPGSRSYSIFSPIWRVLIKDAVRKTVDSGADGIHIDDVYFPGIALWYDKGAPFDSVTMSAFRKYLKDNFTKSELVSKFGIDSIDVFNYGGWIKAHGLESTWNDLPFQGIASEYFIFLIKGTKEFLHEIVEYAHQYALNKYNRQFVVSGNLCLNAEASYFLMDEIDYTVSEHFEFELHLPFPHQSIKALKSYRDWPVVVMPEPTLAGLPGHTENMIKLILADIYASGGSVCLAEKLSEGIVYGGFQAISMDLDVLNRYAEFILSNHKLYENLTSLAQIALINSMASNIAQYWPVEGDAHIGWQSQFLGAGELLIHSNLQYDVLFAPDDKYSSSASFTLEDLQQYKVVVLPNTYALTNEQAGLLLDYMYNGGVIVALGDIGTNRPDGTLANRPELLSLQQEEGVKSYGSGKFVYNPVSLGEAYTGDWGIPHDTILHQFQSMILPYMTPEIKTSPVSRIYHTGGATVYLYKDRAESHILHLVNYDYNEYTDTFAAKENFTLKILADTGKSWEAVYVSPDFVGQQVLVTSIDSGYIKMMVPKLDAYGIIILQENNTVPQIISKFPFNDTTIIAGDSLDFFIQANDSDQNHLFYQWYINGEIDSLAIDSTYHYYTTHFDTGIDTISVIISDGSNKIKNQWIVNILSYTYPKIIFDEMHDQHFSPRLSRVIEMLKAQEGENYNPDHINGLLCDILFNKLRKDYIINSDTAYPLSLSLLKESDVLFFVPFRKDITLSEKEDIQSYINSGGSLLILGVCGWWLANEYSNGNMYKLLNEFGLKTYLPVVRSQDDTLWDNSSFMISLLHTHPATSHADKFQIEIGHKLETTKDFAEIIETTGDLRVWEDINNNTIKDSDEALQTSLGIIGVSRYGKGKVVYMSSHMVANDRPYTPNHDVILSVMKWLTDTTDRVITSDRENHDIGLPETFNLYQNYPNPFSLSTTISFEIQKCSKVSIKIYDLLGREVRTLIEKDLYPGCYGLIWDGTNNSGRKLVSGFYFYILELDGGLIKIKKALLLE